MRKSICLIVFSLLFLGLHAQNRDLIVIDPAHVAAIAAASELDKEAYEDIRENEDQTNQLLIVTNLVNEQIKAIEDTTLNYMKVIPFLAIAANIIKNLVSKSKALLLSYPLSSSDTCRTKALLSTCLVIR